jgi:type VI protein secretion system component VasK
LATGKLPSRIRDRRRWREFLGFLETLRRRRPSQRLYLTLLWPVKSFRWFP